MSTDIDFTERLDRLQVRLPSIPAGAMEVGRATVRRANASAGAVAADTAGRAHAVGTTALRAARTCIGQYRSAVERVTRFATARRNEVAGQVAAQRRIVVNEVDRQVTGALDDAASAIDPQRTLDYLTRAELYELARAAEIEGRVSMTKAQLVRALCGAGAR